MSPESELDMVERHVRDGAAQVARQHQLVLRLSARGRDSDIAAGLLDVFQSIQAAHVAHLARITRPAL